MFARGNAEASRTSVVPAERGGSRRSGLPHVCRANPAAANSEPPLHSSGLSTASPETFLRRERTQLRPKDWRSQLRYSDSQQRQRVELLSDAARDRAVRLERGAKTTANAKWRSWLAEGRAGGLGRQHRMSRGASGWIATRRDDNDDIAFDEKLTGIALEDDSVFVAQPLMHNSWPTRKLPNGLGLTNWGGHFPIWRAQASRELWLPSPVRLRLAGAGSAPELYSGCLIGSSA